METMGVSESAIAPLLACTNVFAQIWQREWIRKTFQEQARDFLYDFRVDSPISMCE